MQVSFINPKPVAYQVVSYYQENKYSDRCEDLIANFATEAEAQQAVDLIVATQTLPGVYAPANIFAYDPAIDVLYDTHCIAAKPVMVTAVPVDCYRAGMNWAKEFWARHATAAQVLTYEYERHGELLFTADSEEDAIAQYIEWAAKQ